MVFKSTYMKIWKEGLYVGVVQFNFSVNFLCSRSLDNGDKN